MKICEIYSELAPKLWINPRAESAQANIFR